jgi:hypothetical protein
LAHEANLTMFGAEFNPSGSSSSEFGRSLDVDFHGVTIVAGQKGFDDGNMPCGGVNVYTRNGTSSNWTRQVFLQTNLVYPQVDCWSFGAACALNAAGDTMLVGAENLRRNGAEAARGVAVVYEKRNSTWAFAAMFDVPASFVGFAHEVFLSRGVCDIESGICGSSSSQPQTALIFSANEQPLVRAVAKIGNGWVSLGDNLLPAFPVFPNLLVNPAYMIAVTADGTRAFISGSIISTRAGTTVCSVSVAELHLCCAAFGGVS